MKKEVKKKVTKSTGNSLTGLPNDRIDVNPQLKNDDGRRRQEEAVDLANPIKEGKALTMAQRQVRSRIFKRNKPKIQRARELAARRIASPEKLRVRAMIAARELVKKRYSSQKGVHYSDLSTSEKIIVDKAVEKKVALIRKLAARLLPRMRANELERYKRYTSFVQGAPMQHLHMPAVNEAFNQLFEADRVKITRGEYRRLKYRHQVSRRSEEIKNQTQAYKHDGKVWTQTYSNDTHRIPTIEKSHDGEYRKFKESYSEIIEAVDQMIEDVRNDDPEMAAQLDEMLDAVVPKSDIELSLEKKAEKTGIDVDVLTEVFCRGAESWTLEEKQNQQQYAFSRVNSFVAGGKAYLEDKGLLEAEFNTSVQRIPYRDPLSGAIKFRFRKIMRNVGVKNSLKSTKPQMFRPEKQRRPTRKLDRSGRNPVKKNTKKLFKSTASTNISQTMYTRRLNNSVDINDAFSKLTERRSAHIEKDWNDQIVAGTYKTQHFEMEKDAQKMYSSLSADSDGASAEQAAIHLDRLFKIRKDVTARGYSNPQDVAAAKDLANRVKHISNKGRLPDHSFVDKHVSEIERNLSTPDNIPAKKHPLDDPRYNTSPKDFAPDPVGTDVNDRDMDNSPKFLIRRDLKAQRKLKIIDGD